ncbi:hypothetical protein MVEN_01297700 [Mycena venus]|uniref:Uncharacterized protein n=1 Tax=Mycena venus TaxID=2733690 RepID=A0A8H6XXB1_9AGAR|nr:hypothetical protein MVEN_01297700 [Mycena venus]
MMIWIALFFTTLILRLEPSHGTVVSKRNASCDDLCDPIEGAIIGEPNRTTCTNTIAHQYAACRDCLDLDPTEMEDLWESQQDYDIYLESCGSVGINLKNFTIPGAYAAFQPSNSSAQQKSSDSRSGHGGTRMLALLAGVLGAGLLDLVYTF